ncbi:DNA polymerase III subunit delta' [Leptothermofonsia sp. ETS-13]|uniref:DNA polymerase III subunit delta' n=1 Tax=Leptothermofonsia sp. ETS-13 TaxID=3035696 RepID=UPI003BA3A08E
MSPFAALIGQPQAVELLTQAVVRERVAPAYLFSGPVGVGRSLAAECFAELLFSKTTSEKSGAVLRSRIRQRNHPDLLWVEPTYLYQGKRLTATEAAAAGVKRKAPPLIRLEQVREISQFLSRAPLEAPRSLVVIECAEAMAEAPANGLLKTLEEPGQATLILIAPGGESLMPTLVSRCQRIPFYRLTNEAVAAVLQQVGQAEILAHPQVLQLAEGSPGEAIAHWQQLQEIPPDLLEAVIQLPRSHRDALNLARQIDKAIDTEAQLWLISYLQHHYWQQLQARFSTQALPNLAPLQHLERAREHLRRYVQPRLVWEVTLLRMVS